MTGSSDIPAPIIRLVHDAEPAEAEGYRPWGSARDGEKPLFLDLRRADGAGEMIAYAYMMRVTYSGDSLVSLICAGGTAFTIEGQGLGKLVRRLQAQEIAFVKRSIPSGGHVRQRRKQRFSLSPSLTRNNK